MNLSQKIKVEDMLINRFIEDDMDLFETNTELAGEAPYERLSLVDKQELDVNMLKYFRENHQEKEKENSVYQGLEFQNFVKIFNPVEEYISDMRQGTVNEQDPAMIWHKVFNRDLNLMKKSAFEGLKAVVQKGV